MRVVLLAVFLLFPACGRAEAKFYAAAGKVDITPDLAKETVWLAGFGAKGRRPAGVHDRLYARAFVVSDGSRTVAVASLDSIGISREDVEDLRRRLSWTGGDRYLFVTATHSHSAPDTLGLWGRLPGMSGVSGRYHRRWKEAVVALVRNLANDLREASMEASSVRLDPSGLCKDNRDPVVLDPELHAVRLLPRSPAEAKVKGPVATIVRWSCHPEVLGSDNRLLTPDYPAPLCAKIEAEGGGTCVFLTGIIGGLLSPDTERAGSVEAQFEEMKRVGEAVADAALKALKSPQTTVSEAAVGFDSKVVKVPVENSRYLLFLRSLVFGHRLLDREGRPLPAWKSYWLPLRHVLFFPLPEHALPWVETEVSRVRIGPVSILGIPGELFPELALGGYDGRHRFAYPLTRPTNPDPPDLKKAPKGPYLRERVKSRHGLLVGLANDEIGYIVPGYDFKVSPTRSMLPRLPGHHYEETNSIGPSATDILLKAYEELLRD